MLSAARERTGVGRWLGQLVSKVSLKRQQDGALLCPRAMFASESRPYWEAQCRRLTFNARLSGNDVLCRVLGRYVFLVDATDAGLAPHLIADGFWEIWITRLIAASVSKGMVCLDAGANLGYYSVLMADLVGPTGAVIAVEPIPSTHRLLARNIGHNGFATRTQLLQMALGAEEGEATLVLPRGEPKNAHLQDAREAQIGDGELDRFRVPMTTIDALGLPRLDVVKIDVEGAEEAVWGGMQATIDRSPAIKIIMEVNCRRYSAPDLFVTSISSRFPLRTIDRFGNPQSLSREYLMSVPTDVVLYLARD